MMRQQNNHSRDDINLNHFIAAYLVPIVKAKGRVHDVSLQVLNDNYENPNLLSEHNQDAQTFVDLNRTTELKSPMTIIDKNGI